MIESDVYETLEEAEKILRFVYNSLSKMTTEQFSLGGDKAIRDKIVEFLDIEG